MTNEFMDVFTVVEGGEKNKDYWLKIGRCFPHTNGDGGFNILLNALPIGNKLIVKPRTQESTIVKTTRSFREEVDLSSSMVCDQCEDSGTYFDTFSGARKACRKCLGYTKLNGS